MDKELKTLTIRTTSVCAIVLFVPIVASFVLAPRAVSVEYLGIFFHLILLVLVSQLKAPEWARASGYGWLILDIATGALIINGANYELATALRYGGHILAGVWIVTSSQFATPTIRLIGTITGLWLGGYTFFSPFFPSIFLAPTSPLLIVWLALLAYRNEPYYCKSAE